MKTINAWDECLAGNIENLKTLPQFEFGIITIDVIDSLY